MTRFVETQLQVAPPQVSPPAPTQPKPNPEPATRRADAKVNQAIDKLIDYNNQPGRLHTDKWQIGISVLKKLTGSSQSVINRVLEQRQDELQNHHQVHQLTTTHNHFHRGKTQVSDVIHLWTWNLGFPTLSSHEERIGTTRSFKTLKIFIAPPIAPLDSLRNPLPTPGSFD